MEHLGTIVLAVGALGTASFGIVESLKWTAIGLAGFGQILRMLGAPVMAALKVAYGDEYSELLRAQYRSNRSAGTLPTTLRQGARIGLTPETAPSLATFVGVVEPQALEEIARALQSRKQLKDEQKALLGRFELALDARIDAALTLAESHYVGTIRMLASLVAVTIALAVGLTRDTVSLFEATVVGLAAVPVAPMAKDLASALQAASKALPNRRK